MAVRSIEQLVRRLLGLPPALRPLRLELESGGSADVEVVVDVPAGAGAAAVHLVDRRDGKVVGGVTLVVGGGIDQPPSTTIEAERPCPIDLAEDPYWLPPGAEPDEPGFGGFAPTGSEMQLVAWIKNPTQVTLEGVTAYLEHLGGSSARFAPVTWNLGTLEPGARFPLTWSIRSGAHATGRWSASVVVAAAGLEPTRIPVAIAFAGDAVEGYEPEELTDPS